MNTVDILGLSLQDESFESIEREFGEYLPLDKKTNLSGVCSNRLIEALKTSKEACLQEDKKTKRSLENELGCSLNDISIMTSEVFVQEIKLEILYSSKIWFCKSVFAPACASISFVFNWIKILHIVCLFICC